MKAAPFDYVRVADLAHALQVLHEAGGDARVLAGGQSLVPMMAMRLAQPAQLVDINRLTRLQKIDLGPDRLAVGACVRQCALEDCAGLRGCVPLLSQVMPWVGHRQTRHRGTVGGSLVQADPSAELPLAAVVLDARLGLASQASGERWLAAGDFFSGAMVTALEETECLTHIEWPVWSAAPAVAAFDEIAIRRGDFAIASAACQLQLADDGTVARLAFGMGGVADTPLAFPAIAARLVGGRPSGAALHETAQQAAAQTSPGSDMHASAEYRRHLAAVLLERVLNRALNDASDAPDATGADRAR